MDFTRGRPTPLEHFLPSVARHCQDALGLLFLARAILGLFLFYLGLTWACQGLALASIRPILAILGCICWRILGFVNGHLRELVGSEHEVAPKHFV